MLISRCFMCLSALVFPIVLGADLKEEMLKFLDDVASSSNVSSAEIYQGQKAGYLTGGGYTLRSRSVNMNPATVTLPRFEGGCGGIDIYTGGFSFINDKQIVEALKSIGTSSAGYAFLLALETVSPQMTSTMKQLQTWANNVNAFNINSCEAAAQLVGSVWPQSDKASEHLCQTLGTELGFITDRVSNRHQCGSPKGRVKVHSEIQKQHPDMDINYNVAWDAIKLQGALMKNKELAELLMTLMGTVIVNHEDVEYFPPKSTDEGFLRILMDGGENQIYSCDNTKKCLVISDRRITIDKSKAWLGRVEALLLSIQKKVLSDDELIDEEVELLVKSSIPLYRYISILTAYKKSVCPIEIHQMAEVIATDLLSRFLRESLESVRISCLLLREHVPFSKKIDEYLATLEFVERSITNYEIRSSRLMEQENSIFMKMDMLEKYIASQLHL